MWIIKILKKYNMEPILFLYYTASVLYYPTPFTKLISDKLCIHKYNLTYDFCYNINKEENAETFQADLITKETSQYIMYRTLVSSIPSIFAAFFIGPWLDKHRIAPKLVLLATIFGGLFDACTTFLNIIFFESDPGFLLISPILSGITGGEMLFITACFVYATKETPLEERTFRFVILELFMIMPSPTANLISSFVLPIEPFFKNHIRNYLPLMLIAISCYLICFLFIIFMIGEPKEVYSSDDTVLKRASIRTSMQPFSSEYLTIKNQTNPKSESQFVNKAFENDISLATEEVNNNFTDNDLNHPNLQKQIPEKTSNAKIFKSLFQLENAINIFKSVVKKREEKAHRLLWMTLYIYLNQLINSYGILLVIVLFTQRTYNWKTENLQRFESIRTALGGIMTTVAVTLMHKIKLQDTYIIAVGISSLFCACFFKGIILYPVGYFISISFGCVFLCALVGIRGFVTKIIPESELGSVLCAMSVIYAIAPVFSSSIYTKIFTSSLDFYPGLVFLFGSALLFINFLVLIMLHFKYKVYKTKMNNKMSTG